MPRKNSSKWYCNWAPSLGELENTAEEVWGTPPYIYSKHKYDNLIQFGCYDLRDYITFFRHKGKKAILWTGGDIENLISGFVFNDGKLKWLSSPPWGFSGFVAKRVAKVPNYVENDVERAKLEGLGIYPKVVPSFLGKIEDFPICYKHSERPQVFISGHPGREDEYGFDLIKRIADKAPECDFHLYGADYAIDYRDCPNNNIITHGFVPKKQFNREIRDYQCGLRPNIHDGFSEITAKSLLLGQYPITRIKYSGIHHYETDEQLIIILKHLHLKKEPNQKTREMYLKLINQYPWNKYANTKNN